MSGVRSDYWLEDRARLEELFRFEPDVIVQYEGVNDILWRHVPAYASRHHGDAIMRRSWLFRALVPIDPSELDEDFVITLENQRRLGELARARGVRHVIGTFARPDASRATAEQRAYLDLDAVTEWSRPELPLVWYDEYAPLVDRYNRLLLEMAARHEILVAPVHEQLTDPSRFVDLCHQTQEGIGDLARAFLPRVAEAIDELPHR